MQRIVLLAALLAVSSLAFGCGRSGQPTEHQIKSTESSAGDQTVKPSDSEASAPTDEPQTVAVRQEGNITEGAQIRQTVNAGCGKCMFNLTGMDSHELAIMINGKTYEVTGEYVDPTESGLCKTVKKAQVVGKVLLYGKGLTIGDQEGEFVAFSIQLQD
ncbi:MAG: DUF6370 family protein [Kiritimatiellia bacterium]|jgi:hypothetical protein|nr:DUF6370 family protein [Kiritimatiellia bacterium]MDP6848462.1 DUF6370 family protein [Kiritimatiellia bacterium]